MKKLFCLLLAVLIPVFSMAACAENPATAEVPPFEILEIGGYDHSSEANHADEIRLTASSSTEQELMKSGSRKIICNSTEYELPYYQTRGSYLYRGTGDAYRLQTTEKVIDIVVNRETNRVDYYSWFDKNYLHTVASDKLTREECLDIARAYLGDYIEDSAQYDLVAESYVPLPEYDAVYDFTFSRLFDGIETCDRALIGVTVYGDVITHNFVGLGSMCDAVLPPQETMDAIQAGLEERLETIYAPLENEYSASYMLKKEWFMRLADGTYALQYDFSVALTPKAEEGAKHSELTSLLVRLS